MGSIAAFDYPVIEFPPGSSDLERGTEGWLRLCKKVREACETYGCFQVVYEGISMELRDEAFALVNELVDEVPLENKQKNINPKPFHGFIGPCSETSIYEGYGIVEASNYDCVKGFAQLMWPDGHTRFCDTVHTLVKQLRELNTMIWLMIIDSYGLGEKWDSVMMEYTTTLRMMKYKAPLSGEYDSGLHSHTDKPASTLVFDDQISGLEIDVDGQWIKVSSAPSSFVFVVGDPLRAWSNGRIKAVNHRVTMNRNKDRFSMAAFAVPVDGTIIKAPEELIDEQHPKLFKDFDFYDFFLYCFSEEAMKIDSTQQLDAYASLSPPTSD